MSWKSVILLIGSFIPILQAQDLTREEVIRVAELQKVCRSLNELVEEQTERYQEMVRAYDTWGTKMERDRQIFNLKESEPPDWESLESHIAEARKKWWQVTQKVHRAEKRLSDLLEKLFGH